MMRKALVDVISKVSGMKADISKSTMTGVSYMGKVPRMYVICVGLDIDIL